MAYRRHGDLLIESAKRKKIQGDVQKNIRLLEGEITGHAHKLSGSAVLDRIEPNRGNLWQIGDLNVEAESVLTHEEHKTLVLPPRTYKIYRQREYDPIEENTVSD